MTPQERAVLEAAKAWAEDADGPDGWAGPDRVLLEAVRALEPPKPAFPEEPTEPYTIVGNEWRRDVSHELFARMPTAQAERTYEWFDLLGAHPARPYSWAELCKFVGAFGGTPIVYRPVTAPVFAVVAAAKAWRARIKDDGGSPIGMWGDDEDFALYEAVNALRASEDGAA